MNPLETLVAAIVDLSWRCSWLLLVVFALRPWLAGRMSARLVFWIWIVLAMRLLLPVSVSTAWSPFGGGASTLPAALAGETSLAIEAGDAAFAAAAPAAGAGSSTLRRLPALSTRSWLAVLWIGGVASLLCVRGWAYARFALRLRRSRQSPDPALARAMREAAAETDAAPINVWVTRVVSGPALHGLVRPALLFPPGFAERLRPDELRFVVAHELAHARRRDLLAHALIHVAAVLHWFNPLVWIAARLARRDCELACDETVLARRSQPERETYGAALLRTISVASGRVSPPAGLGVVESTQELKHRLARIVCRRSPAHVATLLAGALVTVALALSLTRAAQARPPAHVAEPTSQPTGVRTVRQYPLEVENDPVFAPLVAQYPDGIVARVDDRAVTVSDVRRDLLPLITVLRENARDEAEFQQNFASLQNDVIDGLVARLRLAQEFRQNMSAEKAQVIAPSAIEERIEAEVRRRFGGDRAKLDAELVARGVTPDEYRREIEEDLIYRHVRAQQRELNRRAAAPGTAASGASARAANRAAAAPNPEPSGSATPAPSAAAGTQPDSRQAPNPELFERPVRQPRT